MDGIGPISSKAFDKLTIKQQNGIQYEYLLSLDKEVRKMRDEFKRRKLWDKAAAVTGGIVGGIAAALGLKVS